MNNNRDGTNTNIAAKVRLMCGHDMLYFPKPRVGDLVYCAKCRDYFLVRKGGRAKNAPNVWWIDCKQCQYRRSFGTDEQIAKTRATTHTLRTKHVIDIFAPNGQLTVTLRYADIVTKS